MPEGFIQSFKLKVHESDGIEYENLFSKVMSYYIPGFERVKPHGNIGDRGNDGWVCGVGVYYQVYAPEDLLSNEKKSLDKMKGDFKSFMNIGMPFPQSGSFITLLMINIRGYHRTLIMQSPK